MGKLWPWSSRELPSAIAEAPDDGKNTPGLTTDEPGPDPDLSEDESYRELLAAAPISPGAAALLAKAPVTLILTEAIQSEEAFQILEQAHIRFTARSHSSKRAPTAVWSGEKFVGLARIRELARGLRASESVVTKRIHEGPTEHLGPADPGLSQWMADVRERQMDDARAVFARMQPAWSERAAAQAQR